MWSLRVQYQGGSLQLDEVDPDASLLVLQQRVEKITNLSVAQQRIRMGFPPKPIATGPDDASRPLQTFVKNHETLLLDAQATSLDVKQGKGAFAKKRKRAESSAPTRKLTDKYGNLVAREVIDGPPGDHAGSPFDRALDALGDQLVAALDSSASASRGGKLPSALVSATRSEMEKRVAERVASHRYQATLAGTFTISRVAGQASMQVEYTARDPRPERHVEEVQVIPSVLLRLIVASIVQDPDFRENVKPMLMAFVSPRTFWNLAAFCRDEGMLYNGIPNSADLEAGLRKLLPDSNLAFLSTRRRALSEKAMRNRQMATERAASSSDPD
ncbi:hypothetical protein FVE85_2913 [Porphyridium purpureum]|uniref:ubiquitinyl hydrolase 1 n=1 Tax=Porphyridium purpureum TaxID=35688 RepID=A0A5J4YV05_PORPP|nr:hypothetical protein FVE85_2913 [Porphyridium purpureum]|eukprot:POR5321..scf227_4